MKNKLLTALILAFAITSVSPVASAATKNYVDMEIAVLVNARKIKSDVRPKNVNGQTLVELRSIVKSLGAKLELQGKVITIAKGDRIVQLTIGEKKATVNGREVPLMLPANVEKGRTLVPMRFVSEALGEEVVWDHVNRYVWIGHKNVPKLEDAVEAVEIKPFLKYFKGTDSELVLFNRTTQKQHTKVRVIKEMDFPVSIDGEIYYRMDLATTATGYVYTRASTNDNTGTMGTSTYLLQTGQPLKLRGEAAGMREKHGDITLHYNLIASRVDKSRYQIKDWEKLRITNIEYLGILLHSDSAGALPQLGNLS